MDQVLLKDIFKKILIFTFVLSTVSGFAGAKEIVFQQTDTASTIPDTLLFKIQQAQAAINEINAANKKGYGTDRISNDLAELQQNIDPVKLDLETAKKTIDKKRLLSYNQILKDAQGKLADWQKALSKYNADLQKWSNQVVTLGSDSLLMISAKDTTSKVLYHQQLANLKVQLQKTGENTALHLDTVNRLLASVSENYATVTNLQNSVQERIEQTGKTEISKESPYIWAAPAKNLDSSLGDLISSTFQGQHEILTFFISTTWDNRMLLLLFTLAFFYWVHNNIKKSRTAAIHKQVGDLNFNHIRHFPIYASLVVMFSLVPLFEPSSPSFYIEMNQFFLLVILTVHFWKKLDKPQLKLWLFSVVLYMVVTFTSSMVNDALWMRALLIVLNVISLFYGRIFYRKMKAAKFAGRFIKPLSMMYLSFNILAILFNIFGRISLAKMLSSTAIVGITQVVTLGIFIQVLAEALHLQMKVSSCSGGLFSRINLSKTRVKVQKMLTTVAIVLWMLVFFINLSIAGGVFSLIQHILVKPHKFGSVGYTLGNILLFVLIIYVANMLQKNVGLVFGESSLKFDGKTEHKSSKLALLRLIIIFIGVMMAVIASGVPVDKLTVAIGALGVGIGLGLQNIVNNFVSGIILIFEKPFRVGDYVELVDKKGKVKDIGIRSSKLLTAQGSEVIIPNGDLLSGRLVNWTLSNDFLKTEISLKIASDADLTVVYKIIEKEVKKAPGTVSNLPPEILVNAITADNIELKILVWINNIYMEAGFKSDLLKVLWTKFKEAGIKII
jgi:potassium efflux system protein